MKERMISRGDLYYYDFGERVGSVQSGERPVLVVQADDYNKNASTVIVAAVTRDKEVLQQWQIQNFMCRYGIKQISLWMKRQHIVVLVQRN